MESINLNQFTYTVSTPYMFLSEPTSEGFHSQGETFGTCERSSDVWLHAQHEPGLLFWEEEKDEGRNDEH